MASKTSKPSKPAVDVYQDITDRIVEALEAGTVPWRKPWKSLSGFGPTRLDGGKEYQGVNTLLLSVAAFAGGYSSIYWGTYKQISERGGQVRAKQKSTQIVFAKTVVKKGKDGADDETFRMLRFYSVFNVEQADWPEGSKLPAEPQITEADYVEPIEKAERIVAGMPSAPRIQHGGDRAFYSPALDYIGMPPTAAFDSTEGYYATLFHEMGHSTGHAKRLDRGLTGAFASHSYGREELVAEMTAAFLSADAGIADQTFDNSASYLASWIKTIKEDPKSIVWAAGRAQKAADLILDRDPAAESTDDDETKEAA